jgi:hypothetical protein
MSVLIESSIRSVLVAGAVAAVVHGLRIANARARHAAWCGVLAAMLLLPAFCAWGPKAGIPLLPGREDAPASIAWIPVDTAPPAPSAAPSTPRPTAAAPALASPDLLWTMYLLIAGLFVVRLIYGAVRAASVRRRARPEKTFFSSPQCACPITVGWWKPVIVLPSAWTEWPDAELNAVLAHERGHVRRRDPLVQWLAALNRSIFWFHPLAWWLERRLSALAEEDCDAAVIASGHDPRNYAAYLIRQARAVERAGARIALSGAAMGGGFLSYRIRRLIDGPPAPVLSRSRAVLGTTLCGLAIAAFMACRLDRVEKPAAGQPTMHELAERRLDSSRQHRERVRATELRARALTPQEAQQLLAKLRQDPDDAGTFGMLMQYFLFRGDAKGRNALKLWYIAHWPAGRLSVGGIDPHTDPAGYEKGKALWLAALKQPSAPARVYERAAEFVEARDKPLAGSILDAGRKAYPDDKLWLTCLGRHYAQVLLASSGPPTETHYAETVRAQLAESRDPAILAHTARWLIFFGNRLGPRGGEVSAPALQLARSYIDRALSIDPHSEDALSAQMAVADVERTVRLAQLRQMSAAQLAAVPAGDRMILAFYEMRDAAMRQAFRDAASKARDLLDRAARNPRDPLHSEAVFDANMVLGKAALHRGDRQSAARFLLAAAETPGPVRVNFDMNLPRALVDWGERSAVIRFLQLMAPKTARARQFQEWAAQLSKGINPDLLPTFSAPGCTNDPC